MRTILLLANLLLVTCFISACSIMGSASPDRFEQQRFETPQALVSALKAAAAEGNSDSLLKILGPDGRNLVFSGDPVLDKLEISILSQRLSERADLVPYVSAEFSDVSVMKLRLGRMGNNAGIPLINDGKGWRLASRYFAPRSIKRRIASNEIEVWRACMEYFEAQRDYFRRDPNGDGVHEYALRLISTPGKKDGLFWKTGPSEQKSPLAEVIAQAESEGYVVESDGSSRPFHGYIFKILTRQGKASREGARDYMVNGKMTSGFALVAYPVDWSVSGLRTFMVGPEGIIFGKNLGVSTAQIVDKMEEFNPDRTWPWIQQPQVNDFEEYLETL